MMIIAALTSGIAGRLADKIGRKTVLITGLSLLALGFGLAGVSSHPLLFFFFLALTGIGYGFTPPSLYAIMSDLLPNRRGLGASLVSVSYGIGGAIGAILSSRIIATFGWRAAFLTVGIIAAADMLLQLYWIRNISSIRTANRSGSFKDALTAPILILALAEFIGGSVFWSSAAWTPTLLRTAKALTLQETGWLMGLLSLANMLGSFSLGSLSDKFGRKTGHRTQRVPRGFSSFHRVLLVGIGRSPGIGYLCLRHSQGFGTGLGGRAGPGGRAPWQRRRRRRHYHVASLHLGSRGAADCRAAHCGHRRHYPGADFSFFAPAGFLWLPDQRGAGTKSCRSCLASWAGHVLNDLKLLQIVEARVASGTNLAVRLRSFR